MDTAQVEQTSALEQVNQNQPESQSPVTAKSRRKGFLRWGAYGLQGELILPYVVLTLIMAAIGTYIITQLVTSSVRERFINQVYETSRFAADSIIRQERQQLDDLRLAVFTSSLPEALQAEDTQQVEALLTPLINNRKIEVLTVVNLQGRELLTIGYDPRAKAYRRAEGAGIAGEPIVQNVLKGITDSEGDKFADLVQLESGWALCTSAPVRNKDGQLVGVVLVGEYLDNILGEIKSQINADLIALDSEYGLVSATFSRPEEGYEPYQTIARSVNLGEMTRTYDTVLNKRSYAIAYNGLFVRKQATGWLGVLLPSNFVVSTESTSRNLFSLVFALGTLAIIVMGYFLARNISGPILRLRAMSQAVAAGDLNQRIELERPDEIGELAVAFDSMTMNLRERTEEAARLYAETLQRNKELKEINARLEATQLQLVQSEKLAAIGQLTAGIVHDVKNPFAVIMGMAEFLADEEEMSETIRKGLKTIRESAIKGNTIVSDLLKFARQSKPEMRYLDLSETVQASLRLTAYLTRRYETNIDLPEGSLYTCYDAQQIEQVLINLIHNATQAMPNGGKLRVSLAQVDDQAVIEVEDTGTGISPEHLQRIFDPFFTTKPEGEGTGLGLSVSYGMIANHEGQITVSSEVGKGTTFTIRLPMRQPEQSEGEMLA